MDSWECHEHDSIENTFIYDLNLFTSFIYGKYVWTYCIIVSTNVKIKIRSDTVASLKHTKHDRRCFAVDQLKDRGQPAKTR